MRACARNFLRIGSLVLSDILHEVCWGSMKAQSFADLGRFCDFWPKSRFFRILLKIGSLDYFDILHEVRGH